jgi:tripartite-type tricarboxylate transporter receptor subunit TctC
MTRFAISLCLLLACLTAGAQTFPSKPIRVVIPFVAGGSSDIVGRAIAAEFVTKSDPDGHTILVGSIGVFSINSALFKDLRYNPVRDFAPITLAVTTPNVLITKPALAANSMKELVDYAKKNPGKLSYCSSGTGSSDHLTAELLNQVAGISAVHVPYKGGAACQTDIMGGQVDISFQNLGAVTNYIRGNRMKALAVTAKARNPQLPNVPTTAEGGYPDLVVTSWQAAAAPAKTPRAIVAKLNDAAVKALRSPEVRERMNQIGFDVVAGTPEEFGRFMKEELDRWTEVVKRGGIKPD